LRIFQKTTPRHYLPAAALFTARLAPLAFSESLQAAETSNRTSSSSRETGISYTSLQAMQAMKRLKELEILPAPNN
jgi:hypothetical protein